MEFRSEGLSVFLNAGINERGDLELEGQDLGASVEAHWGDSDYEYWVVVPKDYKDTVLLWLLKERFDATPQTSPLKNDSEFMEWLKAKGIPYQFNSYV
ncbi:MAG: hypothetical protein HY508_09015 [Acidobacteria bacterium]|nr:hypothetical protein [Acidobacteriota bacterium]